MAKNTSYQTVGDGLVKALMESKKCLWPSFTIQCGVYSPHDFKHASLEIDDITCLNIANMLGRQFDPNKVAHNDTSQVKIVEFSHEDDGYDDLFEFAKIFSKVHHLATLKLNLKKVTQFKEFMERRLQNISLHMLMIPPLIS